MWQKLVAIQYFNNLPYVAYAGGYFTKMQIQPVANPTGPAETSVKWNAEYRGGGATGLQFTPGQPVFGVEYAQFVGTTATTGDYLVSSPGNGHLWKVKSALGGTYDLAFDKVSLGPLQ